MPSLGTNVQWGNSPTITASFSYEHRRSGSDMQYKISISINPMSSSTAYFGYPIYAQITLAGNTVGSTTLKAASPSVWSSAIKYTSEWFTVSNKTSGSTALAIRLYSGSGSSRDKTYTYSLTVDPASSDVKGANGYTGESMTISITRYSTAFTHTLKYSIGSASGTIAEKTSATSVSWTPPMELCNQMPSSLSGSCTITCETYSGTSLVGSKSTVIQLYVPKHVQLVPQEGCAVVIPYNVGTRAEDINAFVQGFSRAELTINSSLISTAGSYGATPKSYRVSFDGASIDAAPYRTGVVSSAGTKQITLYITDTRDRTTSITVDFTVHSYSAPTLSEISLFRCDSSGTADDSGTYISVNAVAVFSDIGGENSATLSARYSKVGEAFGEYISMSSGQTLIFGDGNVLADSTYIVELKLIDRLGRGVIYSDYIDTETVFFKGREGGTAAGFGKPPERDNVLDVAWDLQVRGDLFMGDSGEKVSDFIIETGESGIWKYRKWHSGKAELWGRQTMDIGPFESPAANLYYTGLISIDLPFTLDSLTTTAFISIATSGVTFASSVRAWSNIVNFSACRLYGGSTAISAVVQIYVTGNVA